MTGFCRFIRRIQILRLLNHPLIDVLVEATIGLRIPQHKSRKGIVPVAIAVTGPLAIAGESILGAVFIDPEVLLRFPVPQLAFCHLQYTLPDLFLEVCRNGLFPVLFCFHGCRIGLTLAGVDVFLFPAQRFATLVTVIGMGMALGPCGFFLAADQHLLCLVACRVMNMEFTFLLAADQGFLCLPAGFILHMSLCGCLFFQAAEPVFASVAVFCVSVFFLAAMGFAGERHGGQDQGVGRAEYDKRCERTHQPSADMAVSFHHQISFLQSPCCIEGPEPPDQLADDLFLGNGSDGFGSGVQGNAPVVPHHKPPVFRHLVGVVDVRFTQCFFLQIRFLQFLAVDVHSAVIRKIHPVSGSGDDALDEELVIVIEGNDIPRLEFCGFHRGDNIAFAEGGGHGVSVDTQDREPQGSG